MALVLRNITTAEAAVQSILCLPLRVEDSEMHRLIRCQAYNFYRKVALRAITPAVMVIRDHLETTMEVRDEILRDLTRPTSHLSRVQNAIAMHLDRELWDHLHFPVMLQETRGDNFLRTSLLYTLLHHYLDRTPAGW